MLTGRSAKEFLASKDLPVKARRYSTAVLGTELRIRYVECCVYVSSRQKKILRYLERFLCQHQKALVLTRKAL